MAAADFASITSALATLFQPRIVKQFNRSVVLAQLLPYAAGETGKNLSWDVVNGTTPADSTIADGADVSTYNDDTIEQAVLSWGIYNESFSITGLARAAAGATRNPDELINLFGHKLDGAITRLAKGINKELYAGTGSNHIIGLTDSTTGALLATGTYAGLDKSSKTYWRGNVLSNGGVNRPNSFQLMRDMRRTIYTACGEMPDLIVCDPTQHEAYGQLFGPNRRYMQEITLRGQKIVLDGGYRALEFDGIPVVMDVDAPANSMLFLNTNYIRIRQLADSVDSVNMGMGMAQLHGTAEEQFGNAQTSLSVRINPLSRTGDAYKFQLICWPQLQVERPNATGMLKDLS